MSSFLMMKRCSFSLPVAATSASNFCRIAGVMAGNASSSCTHHEIVDVASAATINLWQHADRHGKEKYNETDVLQAGLLSLLHTTPLCCVLSLPICSDRKTDIQTDTKTNRQTDRPQLNRQTDK